MRDDRNNLIYLMEKALRLFIETRIEKMGLTDTWRTGLYDFADNGYKGSYRASYDKLHGQLKEKADESVFPLDSIDVTALYTLISQYPLFQYKITDLSGKDALNKICYNYVASIKESRNAFDHYPQEIPDADMESFYLDQLHCAAILSGFALFIMRFQGISDKWKLIYQHAKSVELWLRGEHWLTVDAVPDSNLGSEEDLSELLALAEQGNIEAQIKLGKVYYYGNGDRIKKDFEKAYCWIRKAALRGNAEAQYYLGECLEHGKGCELGFDLASEYYQQSAKQGYAAAQYKLGFQLFAMNMGNRKIPQEMEEAYRLMKAAADQKYPAAVYELSVMNKAGFVVPKNEVEGARLYDESAKLGYVHSCQEKARLEERKGNYDAAIRWLEKVQAHERQNVEDDIIGMQQYRYGPDCCKNPFA